MFTFMTNVQEQSSLTIESLKLLYTNDYNEAENLVKPIRWLEIDLLPIVIWSDF